MKKYDILGVFMIIRSRAPVRISFAGGGTDMHPYCKEYGGCVVSTTINKFAWGTLELRNDNEIHIESYDFLRKLHFPNVNEIKLNNDLDLIKSVVKYMYPNRGVNVFLRCDVPPRSGLGSSASAFVSLIGLFNHLRKQKLNSYEIAKLAYKLERKDLKISGGYQDQFAATFGGLNYMEFHDEHVIVTPMRIKKDYILELEKHLLLVHVSKRKSSNDIIKNQINRVKSNKETLEAMHKTKEIAIEIRNALMNGDLVKFGELLHEAWEVKKKFSPFITNTYINDIYDYAKKHGVIGGKISGAGGGGYFVFYCEENKEQIVQQKLRNIGLNPISFTFDFEGLITWQVK